MRYLYHYNEVMFMASQTVVLRYYGENHFCLLQKLLANHCALAIQTKKYFTRKR